MDLLLSTMFYHRFLRGSLLEVHLGWNLQVLYINWFVVDIQTQNYNSWGAQTHLFNSINSCIFAFACLQMFFSLQEQRYSPPVCVQHIHWGQLQGGLLKKRLGNEVLVLLNWASLENTSSKVVHPILQQVELIIPYYCLSLLLLL